MRLGHCPRQPGLVAEEVERGDDGQEPEREHEVGPPALEGEAVVVRVLVRPPHRREREVEECHDGSHLRPGRWCEAGDHHDRREGRGPEKQRLGEHLAAAHRACPSWARTEDNAATRDDEVLRAVTTPTRRAWPSSTGLPGGRRSETSNHAPLGRRVTRPRRGVFPSSPMPTTHSSEASGSRRAAGAANGPSPSMASSTRPSEGSRSTTRAVRRACPSSTSAAVPCTSPSTVRTWPSEPTSTPAAVPLPSTRTQARPPASAARRSALELGGGVPADSPRASAASTATSAVLNAGAP